MMLIGDGLVFVSGCTAIFGARDDEFAPHEILIVEVLHGALCFFDGGHF